MILRTSITRPNNTAAYSVGDVINADGATTPIALSYSYGSQNPWAILSHLISSSETRAETIDIHLYSESFTIAADNAAFAPTDAQQRDYYLGTISHANWSAWTANAKSDAKPDAPIALPKVGSSTSGGDVYVVLVAAEAHTPVANEVYTIKIDVDA